MATDNIGMTSILDLPNAGQLNNLSAFYDAAGDLFVCSRVQQDTQIHVWQFKTGQGVVNDWQFSTEGGSKADSLTLTWFKSDTPGRANLVLIAGVPINNRTAQKLELGEIADACAYEEGMMTGMHGPNGFVGDGEQPQPQDDTAIINAVDAAADRVIAAMQPQVVAAFGGNVARALKYSAEQAIQGQGVTTKDNIKDTLYQFFMDRVYQTLNDNIPGFWPWLLNKVQGGKAAEGEVQTNESK